MLSHTCKLSAFALSAAMVFRVAAMAADLPKEGTFSGTHSDLGSRSQGTRGGERHRESRGFPGFLL